jgi:hypothetical protein
MPSKTNVNTIAERKIVTLTTEQFTMGAIAMRTSMVLNINLFIHMLIPTNLTTSSTFPSVLPSDSIE